MKKLQRGQGPVHDHDFRISREITTFGYQRPFAHAKWTFQKHFRCAGAQCGNWTWLEELASERNTTQA